MFTTQGGELVSLSWRTGTLGSKRSRLRTADPSNNSYFKIKHMSTASSVLFPLSKGDAQKLHGITFTRSPPLLLLATMSLNLALDTMLTVNTLHEKKPILNEHAIYQQYNTYNNHAIRYLYPHQYL